MRRALPTLALLLGCLTTAAQRSQEYVVTLVSGKAYSIVMEDDWTPEVRQGQIVFRPAVRVLAMDVAVIQPFAPADVTGLKQLKLMPRSPRTGRPGIVVWVEFDPLKQGAPTNNATGLVQAAPQTWVRPEAFRMAIE